jgi:Spy/CpxP family protein refolding chaperone
MTERRRALAVLVAVFLLGSVVGAAGYYIWSLRASADEPGFGPQAGGRRRPPMMQDVLQLSPEQQKRFDAIMEESRNRMQALQVESAPKFKAIRAETDAQIVAILNEEQKKKFEAFVHDMDRRMEHRPGPGGEGRGPLRFAPPPGGPPPGR